MKKNTSKNYPNEKNTYCIKRIFLETKAREQLPDMHGLTSMEYHQPKTQIGKILCYLEDNISEGMTSLDAIREFGATRLAAQVYKLRYDKGVEIESVDECAKNRYGDDVCYSRYFFRGYTNGQRPEMR